MASDYSGVQYGVRMCVYVGMTKYADRMSDVAVIAAGSLDRVQSRMQIHTRN